MVSRACEQPHLRETLKKFANKFVIVPAIDKHPIGSPVDVYKSDWSRLQNAEMFALLTGKKSGITAFDFDIEKREDNEIISYSGVNKFQKLLDKYNKGEDLDTLTAKSPSGGRHLYFKYRPGIRSFICLKEDGKTYGIDCRNDGSNLMMPPSINNNKTYPFKGKPYKFVDPDAKIMEIPDWFLDFINECQRETGKKKKKGKLIIPKGIEIKISNDNEVFFLPPEQLMFLLQSLPSSYKNNYGDWIKGLSCLKSTNLPYAWKVFDEYSETGKNYDYDKNKEIWDSINPCLNINYLLNILGYESFIQPTLKYQPFNGTFGDDDYFDGKLKIEYATCKCQHIAEDDDKVSKIVDFYDYKTQDTWIVKSCQSSGKTTSVAQFCKTLKKKGENFKILLGISRRTLGEALIESFEKYGIQVESYLDEKKKVKTTHELDKIQNLVIQVDSICLLSTNDFSNYVVYFDEINNFINFFMSSTTLDEKRINVINKIGTIIRTAKYIICTDADVSDLVINLFTPLRKNPELIINRFKNYRDIPVTHHLDETKMIEIMKKLIDKDIYFIVCSDSRKRLKILYEAVFDKKKESKFIIYTSKEGPALKNVNKEWKNKWIFYSPTIEYGLDFWSKKPIIVFSYMTCRSITPLECVQQITRARNIKKVHYFIKNRNDRLLVKSVDEVHKYYEERLELYKKNIADQYNGIINRNLKPMIDNENIVMKLFFLSKLYLNIFRSDFHYHFYSIMTDKGFKIKSSDDPKNMSRKKIKEIMAVIEEKDKKAIKNILSDEVEEKNLKLYEKTKMLCEKYLNLKSTGDQKKFKDIIFKEETLQQHFALCNYFKEEDYLAKKQEVKKLKELEVLLCKNGITKILLCKQLEKKLEVDPFVHKISRDIDKEIKIDDTFWKQLKKLFSFDNKTKKPETLMQGLGRLRACYKKLFGSEIIIVKTKSPKKKIKKKWKTIKVIECKLNDEKALHHLELYEKKDSTYKNFDSFFLKKFDLKKKKEGKINFIDSDSDDDEFDENYGIKIQPHKKEMIKK